MSGPENKKTEAKGNRGRFKKGQSGNPGGRPKGVREVIELARSHTELAVSRLAYWAASKEPAASVAASEKLLDRAWGKPKDTVALENGGEGQPFQIIIRKMGES